MIDVRSEETVDIDASIHKAHNASLSRAEQEAVRQHLVFILSKIREPHSQIKPIKEALTAIEARVQPWYMRPTGMVLLAVIATVIGGRILKYFGWV